MPNRLEKEVRLWPCLPNRFRHQLAYVLSAAIQLARYGVNIANVCIAEFQFGIRHVVLLCGVHCMVTVFSSVNNITSCVMCAIVGRAITSLIHRN